MTELSPTAAGAAWSAPASSGLGARTPTRTCAGGATTLEGSRIARQSEVIRAIMAGGSPCQESVGASRLLAAQSERRVHPVERSTTLCWGQRSSTCSAWGGQRSSSSSAGGVRATHAEVQQQRQQRQQQRQQRQQQRQQRQQKRQQRQQKRQQQQHHNNNRGCLVGGLGLDKCCTDRVPDLPHDHLTNAPPR